MNTKAAAGRRPASAVHQAPPEATTMGSPTLSASVAALQQTAGNRAVHAFLTRGEGRTLPRQARALADDAVGAGAASRARVHEGSEADTITEALDAEAVTIGQDIFFARGRLAPETARGKALITHELAHVLQQQRGGPTPTLSDTAAHETAASRAEAGGPVLGATAIGPAMKRRKRDWIRDPDGDDPGRRKRTKPDLPRKFRTRDRDEGVSRHRHGDPQEHLEANARKKAARLEAKDRAGVSVPHKERALRQANAANEEQAAYKRGQNTASLREAQANAAARADARNIPRDPKAEATREKREEAALRSANNAVTAEESRNAGKAGEAGRGQASAAARGDRQVKISNGVRQPPGWRPSQEHKADVAARNRQKGRGQSKSTTHMVADELRPPEKPGGREQVVNIKNIDLGAKDEKAAKASANAVRKQIGENKPHAGNREIVIEYPKPSSNQFESEAVTKATLDRVFDVHKFGERGADKVIIGDKVYRKEDYLKQRQAEIRQEADEKRAKQQATAREKSQKQEAKEEERKAKQEEKKRNQEERAAKKKPGSKGAPDKAATPPEKGLAPFDQSESKAKPRRNAAPEASQAKTSPLSETAKPPEPVQKTRTRRGRKNGGEGGGTPSDPGGGTPPKAPSSGGPKGAAPRSPAGGGGTKSSVRTADGSDGGVSAFGPDGAAVHVAPSPQEASVASPLAKPKGGVTPDVEASSLHTQGAAPDADVRGTKGGKKSGRTKGSARGDGASGAAIAADTAVIDRPSPSPEGTRPKVAPGHGESSKTPQKPVFEPLPKPAAEPAPKPSVAEAPHPDPAPLKPKTEPSNSSLLDQAAPKPSLPEPVKPPPLEQGATKPSLADRPPSPKADAKRPDRALKPDRAAPVKPSGDGGTKPSAPPAPLPPQPKPQTKPAPQPEAPKAFVPPDLSPTAKPPASAPEAAKPPAPEAPSKPAAPQQDPHAQKPAGPHADSHPHKSPKGPKSKGESGKSNPASTAASALNWIGDLGRTYRDAKAEYDKTGSLSDAAEKGGETLLKARNPVLGLLDEYKQKIAPSKDAEGNATGGQDMDPAEAAINTVMGYVGGNVFGKYDKGAAQIINAANNAATGLDAPEGVKLTTEGLSEATPSGFGRRLFAEGYRGLYNTGKFIFTGDAKGLDRQGQQMVEGKGGPVLQGYFMMAQIVADAPFDGWEVAMEKAARAGKGSWADKAGSYLGDQAFKFINDDLPEAKEYAKKDLENLKKSVVDSSVGQAIANVPKKLDNAREALSQKAADFKSDVVDLKNDAIAAKDAAVSTVTELGTEARDAARAMKDQAVEEATRAKDQTVETVKEVRDYANEKIDSAVDTASEKAHEVYDEAVAYKEAAAEKARRLKSLAASLW